VISEIHTGKALYKENWYDFSVGSWSEWNKNYLWWQGALQVDCQYICWFLWAYALSICTLALSFVKLPSTDI